MFGDFLKEFDEGRLQSLTAEEVKQLPPGTALVAIENPDHLRDGGLPSDIRFCIRAAEADTVLLQNPISYDWDKPLFQIIRFPVEMLPRHYFIYAGLENATPAEILQRAESRLDEILHELRSFIGDDFVDECITGKETIEIYTQYVPACGQHWWTPLSVPASFLLEQAQNALQDKENNEQDTSIFNRLKIKSLRMALKISASRVPQNFKTPPVEHHGIVIERGRVVHFSNYHIRVGLFKQFIETTDNTPPGGSAAGNTDQTDIKGRLFTRNRAIWIFCQEGRTPQFWGKYNLFTNNCEHFSRACREKRRFSYQVIDNAVKALNTLLELFPGIGPAVARVLIDILGPPFGYPVKNKHASIDELNQIIESS